MSAFPLMPKATAAWLVENTSLTFTQIATFCGLHELEIQAIADGEVGTNLHVINPINAGQLTQAEIDRCQLDASTRLELRQQTVKLERRRTGPRYTPISKRQDKPDAIAFLLKNFPELSDVQISKLIGTTKTTIGAIKDKSHWNITNIKPKDPVILGLCKQVDLNEQLEKVRIAKPDLASRETAKTDTVAEAIKAMNPGMYRDDNLL
jgi:hypothetical protein